MSIKIKKKTFFGDTSCDVLELHQYWKVSHSRRHYFSQLLLQEPNSSYYTNTSLLFSVMYFCKHWQTDDLNARQ